MSISANGHINLSVKRALLNSTPFHPQSVGSAGRFKLLTDYNNETARAYPDVIPDPAKLARYEQQYPVTGQQHSVLLFQKQLINLQNYTSDLNQLSDTVTSRSFIEEFDEEEQEAREWRLSQLGSVAPAPAPTQQEPIPLTQTNTTEYDVRDFVQFVKNSFETRNDRVAESLYSADRETLLTLATCMIFATPEVKGKELEYLNSAIDGLREARFRILNGDKAAIALMMGKVPELTLPESIDFGNISEADSNLFQSFQESIERQNDKMLRHKTELRTRIDQLKQQIQEVQGKDDIALLEYQMDLDQTLQNLSIITMKAGRLSVFILNAAALRHLSTFCGEEGGVYCEKAVELASLIRVTDSILPIFIAPANRTAAAIAEIVQDELSRSKFFIRPDYNYEAKRVVEDELRSLRARADLQTSSSFLLLAGRVMPIIASVDGFQFEKNEINMKE